MFLSLAAQPDNLGDIEIRQAVLDLVEPSGCQVVALVAGMPPEYVAAFDLPEDIVLHTSTARFARALVVQVLSRRAHLVIAPGPYVLPRRLSGHLKALLLLLGVLATRASGGAVINVGRAIRGSGRLGAAVQRRIARSCSVFASRDELTLKILGEKFGFAPDLALFHRGHAARIRDSMVLSFRGDREIDRELVRRLVAEARDVGLRPVLTTQVRRDEEQHRELAALLDIALVDWGQRAHSDQVRAVREEMKRARWVVSDRLHAVIFGLQYGALPAVVLRTEPDKVVTTLAGVVPITEVPGSPMAGSPILPLQSAAAIETELDLALVEARRLLGNLRDEVATSLGAERSIPPGDEVAS